MDGFAILQSSSKASHLCFHRPDHPQCIAECVGFG